MTIFIIIYVFRGLVEQPFVFTGEENRGKAQAKFEELKKDMNENNDNLQWWKYTPSTDTYVLIEGI